MPSSYWLLFLNSSDEESLKVIEVVIPRPPFYAMGSFQILVGDDSKVHKATVRRLVQKITIEIANLRPHFITMSQNAERKSRLAFTA
ncbi:hypothetical protein ILUMI_12263 [Ignelater luminosus]|uniref:Uncharacterized protein n=1 Tax=Ignelater luminosus TaxID=2038154 RepID=A0A8K0GBY9_IGNLU|nr:hypothetical protein ILUMI_12263 [Ignelater luminosus]